MSEEPVRGGGPRARRIEQLAREVAAAGTEIAALQQRTEAAAARRGRAVVALSEEGLSYKEIAALLGMSAPRVGQMVAAARRRANPPPPAR